MHKRMKENSKLARGEFQFEIKRAISVVKWMENRTVTFLSSLHDPRETTVVKRKNKDGTSTEIFCPEVVAEYNKIISGVDSFDKLREGYTLGRRSVKWWHRIFYFLVDVAIVNSFVLWKINKRESGQHDQLTYRICLARQLIAGFSSRKRRGQKPVFLAKKGKVPDDVRLASVGVHQPVLGDTYRRCCHYSTKVAEKHVHAAFVQTAKYHSA